MQRGRLEALNKKGNTLLIIIVITLFLFITSTQTIQINENQIKTATPTTCGLIGKDYDPITNICIGSVKNVSKTI